MTKRAMVTDEMEAADAGGGDHVMDALCAVVGVTANGVLGKREYADHYVVVVADGRKLQVPTAFVHSCARQALGIEGTAVEAWR
jgi:hypothetical protein